LILLKGLNQYGLLFAVGIVCG